MTTNASSKTGGSLAVVRLMMPYLGKHRGLLAFGILGTIVNVLLSFTMGLALQRVVDGIPADAATGYGYLNNMLMILLPAIALWLLWDFFAGYAMVLVLMRVVRDLRDSIFSMLVGQNISYLERQSSGELQTRLLADTNIVGGFATGQVPAVVAASISMIAGTIGALFISVKLTMIVLASLPFVFVSIPFLGPKMRDFGAKIQQQNAELGTQSGETFRSIKVVQVLNKEAAECSKFSRLSDALATTGVRAARLQMLVKMSMSLTTQYVVLFLMWTAARSIYAGEHTVGQLMAFIYFNSLIVSSVGAAFGLVTSLKQTAGSAERIMEYLSLERHTGTKTGNSASVAGDIEFKNVQFKYPARPEIDVLRGISFKIEAGTSTVIVGPSGAGKSAIFELLLGLYTPDAGTILVDGMDCRELAREHLRSSVGYVPQKESLITGTVFDNIVYGASGADEARVVEAAKLACAHDFIMQLPKGYQTELGEVAARLSGGEKQRISLARALIREPSILLLDEDKSALDADSERRVSDSVRKWAAARGATVISIAHRLSVIGRADRIMVVEAGVVAGYGSHAELCIGCETYRSLVASYSRENEKTSHEERIPVIAMSGT